MVRLDEVRLIREQQVVEISDNYRQYSKVLSSINSKVGHK
jgi:hypothetical protein